MINEVMYGLGSKSSVIRELFSYGLERKKVVGADKVYDFSLGNPSIPAPHQVKDAIAKMLEEPAEVLHGYSPASGDPGVKETLAQSVNRRFGTHFTGANFYMTVGAAASLSICINAVTNPGDEFITFAPFFPEYTVWKYEGAGKIPDHGGAAMQGTGFRYRLWICHALLFSIKLRPLPLIQSQTIACGFPL